jgi:DMSO reductase family type II enzyme heme b subunit
MRMRVLGGVFGTLVSILLLNPPAIAEVTISALVVKQEVSLDPFDPAWQRIPPSRVPLMPQTLFTPRGGGATKELVLQALQTPTHLYLRLEWADATKATGQEAHRTEGFDDTVAVQVPLKPEDGMPSPFMGDTEHPVNIWHWKASWQEQLDMAQAHPRTVRDEERFAKESMFRTGEGVGNLFSQPERKSSVEHLIASGFGTLTTTTQQPVEARGAWRDGSWHVVIRRMLMPGDPEVEVDLRGLEAIPIAFAVWDGAHQERDGMKSVSVWQTLVFERPMPWWKRLFQARSRKPAKAGALPQRQTPASNIALGKRVYERVGCVTCHGVDGRGGIRNPNAISAEEVPPLVPASAGFTPDELKEKIRQGSVPARLDPRGPTPQRLMPPWHPTMSEDELDALTAYLLSLLPEDSELW